MMNSILTKVLLLFAFIITLYFLKFIFKKLVIFYCFLCSIFSVLFKHHTINKKITCNVVKVYLFVYKQYKLK